MALTGDETSANRPKELTCNIYVLISCEYQLVYSFFISLFLFPNERICVNLAIIIIFFFSDWFGIISPAVFARVIALNTYGNWNWGRHV